MPPPPPKMTNDKHETPGPKKRGMKGAEGGRPWVPPHSKGGGLFKSRTPTGCENFWGSGVGGGGGGSAGQLPGSRGGRGSVGTTYKPQNDPHDALIVLNIHNWGKIFFRKNCPSAQAPISQGPP